MAGGLSIDIDGRQIQSLAYSFGATEAQVNAALRSTYGRMGKWLRTRALRGLSTKLSIQQKILRGRVRAFRVQGGVSGKGEGAKVWFGLRRIPLSKLGRPVKESKGVRVGAYYVEGGFVGEVRGRRQVLKRDGKGRLPVSVQYAEISDPAQIYIEDHLIGSAEFDLQFLRLLEHELKWRTQILK